MKTFAEENSMYQKRLFVDMDGVLAKFNQVDTMETLYEKGYFKNLEPMKNVLHAICDVIENKQAEVFILSAVLEDSPYAKSEKNEWLDKYLPEIDDEHRIFPACGEDKRTYVPSGVKDTDYLLDDYTKNLKSWQKDGQGIKLINGINHTKGTWEGAKTTAELPASVIYKHIVGIMEQDELYQLGYYNMTEQQKIEHYTACDYTVDYGGSLSDSDGRLYQEIADEQNKLYIQNLRIKNREAITQGIYPTFKDGKLEFDTEFFTAQEISTLVSWHKLPSNYEMLDSRNGVVVAHNKENGMYSTFSQNADGNLSFENKFNSVNSAFADFQTRVDNMTEYINSQDIGIEI